MGELDGQVAIITGGGRGIGRAIAQALAAAGTAVTVTARSPDQLQETVALIDGAGGRVLAVPADVTDEAAVAHLVAETERQLGPVDLLVNNAGIAGPLVPVWEADPAAWRRCLDINLVGAFLCARAVLPSMTARRRGRIINMSTNVSYPAPYYTAYMASKVALTRLSECLALETAEYGIRVFSIAPGGVHTAMADEAMASPWNTKMEHQFGMDPATRWATPAALSGQLCVSLASGQGDGLSGRHIDVRHDVAELAAQAEQITQEDRLALRVRL
jgi:NAD(P)-dependent dehydrogenase (short-subunit alcohol dehydrogenase family)